jgi:hypothetical protein
MAWPIAARPGQGRSGGHLYSPEIEITRSDVHQSVGEPIRVSNLPTSGK